MTTKKDESALTRVCDLLQSQGFELLASDLAVAPSVNEEAPPTPFMLMHDLPDLVLPGFTWHASGYLNVMLYEPTNEEIANVEKR